MNNCSLLSSSLMCLTRDDSIANHFEQVKTLLQTGAKLIQLRSKSISRQDLYTQAKGAADLCKKHNCTLIINDDYNLAKYVDAEGVHVGIDDAPIELIRNELPEGKLIGKTVHSIDEAKLALIEKPDYVGLGPYRSSYTKKDLQPTLNEEDIKHIVNVLSPLPIFLIGGLSINDFYLIEKFDIQGLALCSALFSQGLNSTNMKDIIQKSREYFNSPCFS